MDTLIHDIKAYCNAHYEEGFDTFVECYDISDYAELIQNANITTVAEFIDATADIRSVWDERRADAASYREDY